MNSKLKRALQRELSTYKFDTSNYIIFDSLVQRDSSTGRFVISKPSPKKSVPKAK